MKKLLLLLLLIFCAFQLNAQKNNFEIGFNDNLIFNTLDKNRNNIYSLSFKYSRLLNNNWYRFVQCKRLPMLNARYVLASVNYVTQENIGKIFRHHNYNYFDVGVQYNILQHKQHIISFIGGISLAYGTDRYLEKAYWIYGQGYPEWGHIVHLEFRDEKATYWGGVAGIKYDYLFWKNRINIGPEFAARYYTNGFPYQFSYGLHIGFNF